MSSSGGGECPSQIVRYRRIENVPPVEYEMNYYRSQEGSLEMARLN